MHQPGRRGRLAPHIEQCDQRPGALASTLSAMLADRSRWQDAVQAAAERIRRRFDARAVAAQVESLYGEVIARRSRLEATAPPRGGSGASGERREVVG